MAGYRLTIIRHNTSLPFASCVTIALWWRHMGVWVPKVTSYLTVFNSLFKRTTKTIWSFALVALCEGNPPVPVGFPSQRATNAKCVFISWRHHEIKDLRQCHIALIRQSMCVYFFNDEDPAPSRDARLYIASDVYTVQYIKCLHSNAQTLHGYIFVPIRL